MGVGVVVMSVADVPVPVPVPALLVLFFCCSRYSIVAFGMEKGESESKTVLLFGFDMEVFAVVVPYAYEPSRFSPFPKEDCASYTQMAGNLRMEV